MRLFSQHIKKSLKNRSKIKKSTHSSRVKTVLFLLIASFFLGSHLNANELTTTFNANKKQIGNFFNIVTKDDIIIKQFHGNFHDAGTASIWHRSGTGYDFMDSSTGWTQVGTNSVASGSNVNYGLSLSLRIPKNTTYGFLVLNSGKVKYNNGSSVSSVYSENSDLQILEGYSTDSNSGFGGNLFSPRVVNIRIEYDVLPDRPIITNPLGTIVTSNNRPVISGTGESGTTTTLFANGTSKGQDPLGSGTTWSITSSTLADGTYTITSNATNGVGNTSFTSTQNLVITVDTTPPDRPIITDPLGTIITNNTTPVISGTAENGSTVRVFAGGTLIGQTVVNPGTSWSITSSVLAENTYTITANATDGVGNTSSPSIQTLSITVDTTAPNPPIITNPLGTVSTTNRYPVISGTAENGSTVRVFAEGTLVGSDTISSGTSWSVTTTELIPASYNVTANATDAATNVSTVSTQNLLLQIQRIYPEAPFITSPTGNVSTINTTPIIRGTAQSNMIITVFGNGTSLGQATTGAGTSWTITSTDLALGTYAITANATDVEGYSGSSSTQAVTINVYEVPVPTIVLPLNNTVTNNTTPVISGTGSSINTVEVYINGSSSGTTNVSGENWSYTTPTLSEGTHLIKVRGIDDLDYPSAFSAIRTLIIDLTGPDPPIPSLQFPVDYSNQEQVTLSGTSEANCLVEIFYNGSFVSSSNANSNGEWSSLIPETFTHNDNPKFTFRCTDTVGNIGNKGSTYNLVIDFVPPTTPSIATPTDTTNPSITQIITSNTKPVIIGVVTEPSASVTLYIDGNSVGNADTLSTSQQSKIALSTDTSWSYTFSNDLAIQSYLLTTTATDLANNTSSTSSPIVLTIIPDPETTAISISDFIAGPNPIDFNRYSSFVFEFNSSEIATYTLSIFDISRHLI
ncbi:hypothetical protein DID77_02070, partial [Candidatus Marinamargulisbacteria bacterium SCGC AG-439-L15]